MKEAFKTIAIAAGAAAAAAIGTALGKAASDAITKHYAPPVKKKGKK